VGAAAALEAGVTVVQLRAKNMPAGETFALARELGSQCRSRGVVFLVNDRLDVALAAGADGVHLGQDDLPLAVARQVAGPDFILGASTHSLAEALAAEREGADYLGFGAMYPTTTKKGVTAPQGPEALRTVVSSVRLPVIAIGGIKPSHLPEIRAAGAAGAAVISALGCAPEVGAAGRELVAAWNTAALRP
jgi:thiamine-phosphate pyrophosphorylase